MFIEQAPQNHEEEVTNRFINPNPGVGGGAEEPILHFLMQNHPSLRSILFKLIVQTRSIC